MKLILFSTIILLTSCTTVKNYFEPPPPLKEGEVPYVLKPGVYEDVDGNKHLVTTEAPRWSVSQAYIYDAVSTAKPISEEEKIKARKKYIFYGLTGLFGILVVSALLKRFIGK